MRTVLFSARPYDVRSFEATNAARARPLDLTFQEARLDRTTVSLAADFDAVVPFVNDVVDADVIAALAAGGTRLLALRSSGFNHVDLRAAEAAGITVMRVPAYSPHAVAEFTVGLMLAVERRIHRAAARVRDGNFSLEGLLGSDLHDPFMAMSFMALEVIPKLKLTDQGLVDVEKFALVDLFVNEG